MSGNKNLTNTEIMINFLLKIIVFKHKCIVIFCNLWKSLENQGQNTRITINKINYNGTKRVVDEYESIV